MTMTATRSGADTARADTDGADAARADTAWAVAIGRTGASWREELVELLVLAEHGDEAAATRLSGWRATDAAAETLSAAIIRDVAAVRAGGPGR